MNRDIEIYADMTLPQLYQRKSALESFVRNFTGSKQRRYMKELILVSEFIRDREIGIQQLKLFEEYGIE